MDWRTGEPLRLEGANGGRGWYMKWDPDNCRWVAENPGAGYEMPKAGLPATGKPGSYSYDKNGNRLPYANSRPDYADGQVEAVWENSKRKTAGFETNTDGTLFYYDVDDVVVQDIDGNWYKVEWDPNQPGARPWDMGHTKEAKYSKLLDDYLSGRISEQEFLEEYHNPKNYQVEDPLRNQSHVGE